MHKTFGKGLVIAIKETSGGKQITVQFDGLGLKNLILEASPIEVIGS
jgi:DNA helicase-2/ATP-dependent DNA helicase PcrA